MPHGNDEKKFLQTLIRIIGYLDGRLFIEIDNPEYGAWGSIKEGNILFDYNNHPIKAKITSPLGLDFIEKIISSEEQSSLTTSIKSTNAIQNDNIKTSGKLFWLTLAIAGIGAVAPWVQFFKDSEKDKLRRQLQDKDIVIKQLQDKITQTKNVQFTRSLSKDSSKPH